MTGALKHSMHDLGTKKIWCLTQKIESCLEIKTTINITVYFWYIWNNFFLPATW